MTRPLDPKALESAARNLKTLITIYDGQYDLNDNRRCHDMASATVGAYLKAARTDGCVMVPKEPTEKMVLSGFNAYQDSLGTYLTRMEFAYKAMIAAAPKPPTPTEKE